MYLVEKRQKRTCLVLRMLHRLCQARRETLRLLVVGQRSHPQVIRLPLVVCVQEVAAGGPDSQFVVGHERRALVSDRQAVGRRTARSMDFTQTEDH